MNEYTFDDIWLLKNGEPSICPNTPGVLAPKKLNNNETYIDRMPCNKRCPFMSMQADGSVLLFCMKRTLKINIKIENNGKIIKIS